MTSPDENGKKSKYPLTRGTLMKVLDVEMDEDEKSSAWYKVLLEFRFRRMDTADGFRNRKKCDWFKL